MIETIALVLTGIGLTASLFYYSNILKNANKTRELQLQAQKESTKTRQLQIFMQLQNGFNAKENLLDFAELMNLKVDEGEYREKYDSYVNPEFFAKRASVWYYYNSIGELLRMGLVEKDLLHRLNIDINAMLIWENWEHIIKLNRERENMPDLWDGFEYLYNEMKELRSEMGYPDITYNP